jgi:hypothetical protein
MVTTSTTWSASCAPPPIRSTRCFFFLADNGTAPIVHDAKVGEAKGTTRERGIHVPFFAAGPGLARGQRCSAPVSIVDVMATVAEATGPALERSGPGGEDSVSVPWAHCANRPRGVTPRPWIFAEKFDERGDARVACSTGTGSCRRGRGAGKGARWTCSAYPRRDSASLSRRPVSPGRRKRTDSKGKEEKKGR